MPRVCGADDYLTKPFSFEVLLARVRAVGRRAPIAQPVVLETAGLTIHLGTREVRRGARKIELEKAVQLLAPMARQVLTEMNTSLLLDTGRPTEKGLQRTGDGGLSAS